jgi:predicted ATPase/DNA-binding winged helix-turn-helix (wHTH) protein
VTGPIVSFGTFQLDTTRLQLSEGGHRLDVGARACALLLVLLQRKGEIVSSRELLEAAWPGVTVDEVNVRVHVTALRKALRDGKQGPKYIHTIPRRGYSFVGEAAPAQSEPSADFPPELSGPPQPLASLVGRAQTVEQLDADLSNRRIVTVVGPGGIGKTSVALAVAAVHARNRNDASVFVDLATATSGAHVAERVFAALALRGAPEDLVSYIVRALRERTLLLVLDNCDQVIDAVARLVNEVARGAPNVRILATSREALRAHGEHVHALGPLETPSSSGALTAQSILEYSAARLFVEAARAHADGFRIDDYNAALIGDICTRLDGIPLALELAAATTDFLTVRELAERLDDRFAVLTRGYRTAPPRHRTMLDALEWGHSLLSPSAAVTMRRLGVFPSHFGLKDAVAVAADASLPADQVLDGVAELQSKSLLAADISGDTAEFRFLETVRAFATAKLGDANERDAVHRRHAMRTLETLWGLRQDKVPPEERAGNSRRVIDDLSTAHSWAASPQGDRRIALDLLSQSSAIWRMLNLDTEFITRARETLAGLPEETPDSLGHEMNVQIALSFALNATQGRPDAPSAAFQRLCVGSATRAVELSERIGNQTDQIRALWALIGATIDSGHNHALINHVAALERLAASLPAGPVLDQSTYLRSLAYHSVGQLARSARVIGLEGDGYPKSPSVHVAIDRSLGGRSLIARTLWLRGDMAAARDLRDEGMAKPLDRMDPSDVVFFLTSCGVSFPLWDRDVVAAEVVIERLEQIAVATGRPGYASFAPILRAACTRLQESGGSYASGQIDWSPATALLGDAMTCIHCSFHQAADLERIRIEPSWAAAEHLRSAGEHALFRGGPNAQESAEACFSKAAGVAAEQGALFWELRAAVSLARLYRSQGREDAARKAVAGVVSRFDPQETCADIADARTFLAAQVGN